MFDRQWIVRPGNLFGEKDGMEALERAMLGERGISEDGANAFFVPPRLPALPEEEKLEKAAGIILDAIDAGQKLTVYGDYDCDGICSTVIMYHFLTHVLEADADWAIPDRFSDGYGISPKAVERLCENGTGLIITVDNGISAFPAAERAGELGVELVITDHHKPGDELPRCAALIDPHLPEDSYPFRDACGAGVAYMLCRVIARSLGMEDADIPDYLPLTAIATVGDSVPLKGDNRAYVRLGIGRIERILKGEETEWQGLRALLNEAGLKPGRPLTAQDLGFKLVPRINAAGRLGSAGLAMKLMLAETTEEGEAAARALSQANEYRKTLEQSVFDETLLPGNLITSPEDPVIVTYSGTWHEGVLGIVANKLSDKYSKPALVLAGADESEDPVLKGSCRSTDAFDIYEGLTACAELLERYGGHKKAAGLSVKASKLHELARRLCGLCAEANGRFTEPPHTVIDAVIPFWVAADRRLAELIRAFEPTGEGNRRPLFAVTGTRVLSARRVGADGGTLKLIFSGNDGDNEVRLDGVSFRNGALCDTVSRLREVTFLGYPEVSSFDPGKIGFVVTDLVEGNLSLEKQARCMYNDAYMTFGSFSLEKRLLRAIYRGLAGFGDSFTFGELAGLREALNASGIECTWYQLKNAVEVFTSVGIISRPERSGFVKNPVEGRVDLEAAALYRALEFEEFPKKETV